MNTALSQEDARSSPSVALVIPAHNEDETIHEVLSAVTKQDYANLSVIVVDDGSTDDTARIAAGFESVRVISNEKNLGLARSMNVGLKATDADVLMVLHADCVPQGDDWVAKMVSVLDDKTVGAVVSQRKVLDRSKMGLPEKLFDAMAPQTFTVEAAEPVDTRCVRDKCDAYRGDLLRKLGCFDADAFFVSGEDTDLSFRMRQAGYRIVVSHEAVVEVRFSSHQRSMKSVLWRKPMQYGGAAVALWKRHRYDGLAARVSAATWVVLAAAVATLLGAHPAVGATLCGLALLFNLPPGDVGARRYSFGLLALVQSGVLMVVALLVVLALPMIAEIETSPGDVMTSGNWIYAVAIAYLAYLARRAWQAAATSLRTDNSLPLAVTAFAFAVVWRMLSGLGYLAALFSPASRS